MAIDTEPIKSRSFLGASGRLYSFLLQKKDIVGFTSIPWTWALMLEQRQPLCEWEEKVKRITGMLSLMSLSHWTFQGSIFSYPDDWDNLFTCHSASAPLPLSCLSIAARGRLLKCRILPLLCSKSSSPELTVKISGYLWAGCEAMGSLKSAMVEVLYQGNWQILQISTPSLHSSSSPSHSG